MANFATEQTEQTELIKSLREPAIYPHPVTAVEVLETHISYVLLAGDFAYKFKKPLDLGFLDYSTLAARKFFCEEELRLNRRLAPHLYLDVVSIYGSSTAPRFVAVDGEVPIEHAVRMRRFRQEMLFDRLAQSGGLHDEHIDSLAEVIAAFHRDIPPAGVGTPYGTAAAIEAPLRQNFAQLRPLLDTPVEHAELDSIEQWSLREYTRCVEVGIFAARRATGCVRECHGDLHLGNVAWLADTPDTAPRAIPFDGIEFAANLRWIDVISEVAFIVMDLHARGFANQANRFLNRWLEQNGDLGFGGLALLDFYLVYRAMVRAKIARIRASQSDTCATERQTALSDYAALTALARRFAEPRRCALILMHGVSGSGKSVLAATLCENIDAIRIRSDVERKRLHGLTPMARSHAGVAAGLYSAEATRATYEELARLARQILQSGRPVLVDACFLRVEERATFRTLAETLGVPLLIVSCTADTAELRRRVAQRHATQKDVSEADLAVLEHQLEIAEALDETFSSGELRITIDTHKETTMHASERLVGALARLPG